MDHQKRSNVANVFSNDSKDSEITIYTLDREMGRIKKDEHFHNSEPRTKIKANLYHEPEAMASHDGHSVASQASPYPPYRLNFLPPDDWKESDTNLQVISKLLFSECSLACFLIFWLISTALLFYLTEGPFEYELSENLKILENSTMVSMATDLRILEPDWDETLIKYMEVHKQQILSAVRNGYKNENIIWTFPGSLLSAISIIATLGLAAPLPVTSEGKIGAMIFTSFGLPIHFIFIIHLGRTIAVRLQLFAKVTENKVADLRERIDNVRRFGEDRKRETWPEKMFIVDFVPPPWLCYFPILSYLFYYIIGFLIFGLARNLPMSEMFVFFVDFSQGHESNGFSRMGYCWYLEGFAILTGINIAILRDSPMTGFTSIALSHGLLTNSID
ncbi:uncharacterized protein [Halyomorpha halys]|nr:uncharacterized protein LOC106682116 [Halyomorpha halys]